MRIKTKNTKIYSNIKPLYKYFACYLDLQAKIS